MTVTAWTASDEAWSTDIEIGTPDGSGLWATSAVREASRSWPSLDAPLPAIGAPLIEGAPAQVAGRTPYPFCGTLEPFGRGDNPRRSACFLAAVLTGRPAELLEDSVTGDGVQFVTLYRFTGAGAVRRYIGIEGRWSRDNGGIGLPPIGLPGWSYIVWPDGSAEL